MAIRAAWLLSKKEANELIELINWELKRFDAKFPDGLYNNSNKRRERLESMLNELRRLDFE